jgi:pimeloyl-ACP methyl ester carboxylesterase
MKQLRHPPRPISLPGRVRLEYLAQGDLSGTPVVLLHGYGDTCRSFEPLLAALPRSLRVLALTQRGHGDAEACSIYTIGAMATDVVAFLDAMGLERAVLVGHSMGSSVAQRVAIRAGHRVLGLALLGGFASVRGNPCVADLQREVAGLADPVDRGFVTMFQASMLASPLPDDYFAMLVDESCKMAARAWREVFRGIVEGEHDARVLRGITAPTLLVWGDRDAYVSRRDQQVLQEAITGARLVVHAGRGHCPHWEDPAAVAAELTAFAESLRPA